MNTSRTDIRETSRKQEIIIAKMQWGLFLLILMGECSFCVCHLYEYTFIEQNMKWTEAQTYCRQEHTDLATVYDVTDMNRLHDTAKTNGQAWIGLHTIPGQTKTWHWSLPGVEFNETEWKRGEPNDETRNQNCAVVENGKWIDEPCSTTFRFICYNERKESNEIFPVISTSVTWSQAQRYCREKHTDLISGVSQLNDMGPQNNSNRENWLWIGLFRDTWTWSDSSSSSFRNFNNFEAGNYKKCASVFPRSGNWSSDNCNKEKPFFCYDDKVILIQQKKTWDEALDYCRENYNDLVSITNLKEQRWVQDRAKNASTPFVWLGLRYTCTLEFWFWVSDETVTYKNWVSGGRHDDCNMSGAMKGGGKYKWYKKDDSEKFNFICSKF